jgi:hypothetical protein
LPSAAAQNGPVTTCSHGHRPHPGRGLDADLVDPEGKPLVGDGAVDEDLVRGAEPADGIQVGDRGWQQVQRLQRSPGRGARAVERDALRFVRGIQHADSPDRPRTAVVRPAATSAITR